MTHKNLQATVRSGGQSLLVLVLMIALILAVVSATSYRLTIETRTTKLQEESVRALAAADAGIEFGLRQASNAPANTYSYSALGLNPQGIDTTRSRVIITNTSTSLFTTPVIPLGSQYTFYLKDPANPTAPDYGNLLVMYFRNESLNACAAPRTRTAYEITYIYGATMQSVRRDVIEPCTIGDRIQGGVASHASGTYTPGDGFTYTEVWSINVPWAGMPNLRTIIVRPLFGAGRIAFQGPNLTTQGKLIRSEAYSQTGSSKVVTVFQSLPQIPAEFFVTTF